MERLRLGVAIVLAVSASLFVYGAQAQSGGKSQKRSDLQYREWRMFGGGAENIHYSTLDQIIRDNVHRLEVAWRFDVRLRQIDLNPCTGRYENQANLPQPFKSVNCGGEVTGLDL
jgi:glucose dehydrogenase